MGERAQGEASLLIRMGDRKGLFCSDQDVSGTCIPSGPRFLGPTTKDVGGERELNFRQGRLQEGSGFEQGRNELSPGMSKRGGGAS